MRVQTNWLRETARRLRTVVGRARWHARWPVLRKTWRDRGHGEYAVIYQKHGVSRSFRTEWPDVFFHKMQLRGRLARLREELARPVGTAPTLTGEGKPPGPGSP